MATRSMIAFWDEETGVVHASYCHYDGYVLGVGQTLVTYYYTNKRAQAIATIGYASSLEDTVMKTLATAVHKESPVVFESVEQYIKTGFDYAGAEYLYLWDGEAWFVAPFHGDRRFTDVETVLNADPRTEQMISNF